MATSPRTCEIQPLMVPDTPPGRCCAHTTHVPRPTTSSDDEHGLAARRAPAAVALAGGRAETLATGRTVPTRHRRRPGRVRPAGRRRGARNRSRSACAPTLYRRVGRPSSLPVRLSVGRGQDRADPGRDARVAGQSSGRWCARAHDTASGRAPAVREPRGADLVVVDVLPDCARPRAGPARPARSSPRPWPTDRPNDPRPGLGLADVVQERGRDVVGIGVGAERRDRGARGRDRLRPVGAAEPFPARELGGLQDARAPERGRRRRAPAGATTRRSAGRDDPRGVIGTRTGRGDRGRVGTSGSNTLVRNTSRNSTRIPYGRNLYQPGSHASGSTRSIERRAVERRDRQEVEDRRGRGSPPRTAAG